MDSAQNTQQPVQSVQPAPGQNTVVMPTPEAPDEPSQSTWVKPLLIVLGIATFMVLATLGILLYPAKKYQPIAVTPTPKPARIAATMSGTVYLEGYAPTGSYLAIAERTDSHSDFKDVVSELTPETDGTTAWTWNDASVGKNYEIKATLKVSGKVVESSAVQNVSAPAQQVGLTVVSELTPPAPVVATLTGQINLDGYAPTGSTLQVLAQKAGAASFQTVVTNIAPSDNATWTWGQAGSGTTYLVKAQLVNANGTVISTGDTQTLTAPSGGVLLNVASTATPPAPATTGISGTITINGSIPSGAYLTLATRPSGTVTFNQVASNISATNSVPFSWNGAASGQSYDVQAYLWSNNQPYSQSNIITVTAPSTFDVLTINAQQPTQAPSSGTINVSCGGTQGGLVQATINFNTSANLPNASSYNIVVTSASQNQQVVNTTINPSNPTQSQSITTTFVLQPGATYFAQYAYATSNGGQMSALSPSVQFSCQ